MNEKVAITCEIDSYRLVKKDKQGRKFQRVSWVRGTPIHVTDYNPATGEVLQERDFPEGTDLGAI